MGIQIGNTSIEIASHTSAFNSRICWSLENSTSNFFIGLWSTPLADSNTLSSYQNAGVVSPFIGLNQALSFIIDGSNSLGERETVAEQALAYCQVHYNSAYARGVYIYDIKGQPGDCCQNFIISTKCFGNQGIDSCCWTGTTLNYSKEGAGILKNAIRGWRDQFEAQLSLIQLYQEDGLNDAEFQAQINLEISKVNQAIAKTKSLQEQVKLSEFLGKTVRYVIPLIAIVILFFGWNLISKKR